MNKEELKIVKGYNNVRLGGTWRDRLKGWLIYIKSIFQMMRRCSK